MRNIDEIKDLIKEIKRNLIDRYSNKIKQVIIYGSFARGEATKDSDIDIAIIIDDNLSVDVVEEGLSDFLFDILLEKNELISAFAIPEKIFKNYNSPYILNVKKEAIII